MSGYTPLFSSIVMSSIWDEDNETRIVWITLLAMAGADGVVEGSITGLAHSARVPISVCQKAIKKLTSPDQYSQTKEDEGRRIKEIEGGWMILNHKKYREKAKSRAAYMRRYREEKKKAYKEEKKENSNLNTNTNSVTACNSYVTSETVTDFPIPPDMQRWQDIAFKVGLTPEEGQNSYDNFSANGWTRGNGVKIESWKQIPGLLRYWRNNRQNFTPKNKATESAFDQLEQIKRGDV